jgi:hypothetical protein
MQGFKSICSTTFSAAIPQRWRVCNASPARPLVAHSAGKCICPRYPIFHSEFARHHEGLDSTGIPCTIGIRADLGHALGTSQFLELEYLVMHGQLVSTLPLAVEPFQDLGSQAKRSAQ